jgi:SAM-dependent methyltransferase
MHHHSCPLCSSSNIAVNMTCTDHFISQELFQIAKCNDCGFEFTQDYPEETEIGRYYESDEYISHSDTSKGFSNKLYRFARNLMLKRKLQIIRRVTHLNTGKLLDIGSGTGYFGGTMKKAGWQVNGVEINEKARNFSKSRFELDVIHPGSISLLPEGSFDCITLWHVLEHFHDPDKYASYILRLLRPDGICVIALPNNNSYDAKHYGRFWAAYDLPRHLWHFNPDTFSLFAKKSGFIIETVSRLPLDVFYISVLSEKYRGSRLSFIRGTMTALLFAFLSIWNKERSSSVIYVLRRANDQ